MRFGWKGQRRVISSMRPGLSRLGVTQPGSRLDARRGENVFGYQKELAIPQQASIGTSASVIKTNNPYRDAIIITNLSATATLFVGPYYVTVGNGQAILPGLSFTFPTTAELWGVGTAALTCTFVEVGAE